MALTNQYQSLACRHLNWNVHPANQVGFASCLDCGRDVSLGILFNDLKARMEVAMRGNDSFGYATGEKCGVCGRKRVYVRGVSPHDPERLVCPQCLAERMDSIYELSNRNFGIVQEVKKP